MKSRLRSKDSPAINAALISVAQKVEHYEIASYGCLHEWAGLLGNKSAASLLRTILNEEKAADESLTRLARASSNVEALNESGAKESAAAAEKHAGNVRRGIRLGSPRSTRAGSMAR